MPDLAQLLEQVFMNGLINRAWDASGRDVPKFIAELTRTGEEHGYLFEVGPVEVVDGKPVIDWPCVYVPEADRDRPRCKTCGR